RTTPEGTLLVMEPRALRKRPDELFDPRENAFEITAEDRRGRRYYQNWIVRVNDKHQNALFGYLSSLSADDPKAIPPDLVIMEPTSPPLLRVGQVSTKVLLKGRMSPGASLRVNGQIAIPAKQGPTVDFEYTAIVRQNEHELVVDAVDAKGNARKVIIPVYAPPSARPSIRFGGQKYAVLIGVSQFGV